ncbi:MAG TPA: SBBP repeat-containing protein [Chthonomonadaceae bacterium]|nr:SBBP repeat-containing protein [Chthonomonadaceae bacterium]
MDRARSIAVDKEGNVYVTGDSDNGKGNGASRASGLDWATVKYDPNGKQLWVARYNSPDDGEDRPVRVCVDRQGFVYVAGYSIVRRHLNGGIWLRKQWEVVQYEPLRGRQMWVREERPPEDNLEAEAVDMAVSPAGDVTVTGNYMTLLGVRPKTNVLTLQYAQNGDVVWRKTYPGKGFGDVFAHRLALDGAGNVTIIGEQYDGDPENNGTRNDFVTLKYDAEGNQLWTPQIYDNRRMDDSPDALAVDESGAVCVAGHTGPQINLDYLTVLYDPNGALLWANTYNGTANGPDHANNVAFDHAGNVIVTGYAQDAGAGKRPGMAAEPIIRGDNVTLKYDRTGNILWKGVYGYVWGPDDSLVAIDAQNGVIVSGQCNDSHQNLVITTFKYAPDADTGPTDR